MVYEQLSQPIPIALHLRNFQLKREMQPVGHDEKTGTWHIYRYSDVARVLADARHFGAAPDAGAYFSAFSAFSQSPPVIAQRHELVRNILREAVSPHAVLQMQPYVQRTVGNLLEPLLSAGKLEVISELARPLATSVIAEFVGVPVEAMDSLVSPISASGIANGHSGSGEWPARSLISRLLSIEDEGERLTHDEVAAAGYFFIAATRRALSDTVANMLLLLSLHPDVLKRLRREPAPLYSTVEEALRYLPPIWTAHRVALAPVALGGQELPQGAYVCAWIVSANHDPEQFDHPERFDIDRIPNRHLSFGDHSAFSCFGSGLTRLVARLTLAAVAQRFSAFELAPGDTAEVAWPCGPGEQGETEDAQDRPESGEQMPAAGELPAQCSLTKLPIVFEARD